MSFGLGGFCYRQHLSLPRASPRGRNAGAPPPVPGLPGATDKTGAIHTATASELAAVSQDRVLADLQKRLRRPNLFRCYLWLAGTSVLLALAAFGQLAGAITLTVLIAPGVGVYRLDRRWRLAQLSYDLEDQEIAARLSMASRAGEALASAARLWHVHHAVQTSDWKRNAGANTLIQRTRTHARPGSLPGIELDIEPWSVPVGPQRLLLLPDQLLIWDGRTLAGVPYEHLRAEASATRFIEEESVPSDTRILDTTWRYVNKHGGPDRRFSDNRELPVVEYGGLQLSTGSGLRIFLNCSTVLPAVQAAAALEELSARARIVREPARASRASPTSASSCASPASVGNDQSRPERPWVPALMLVARHLVGVDRRIGTDEVAFMFEVHRELTGSTMEATIFSGWFRGLPTDRSTLAEALGALSQASPEVRCWVVDCFARLSHADGGQTPKEVERLAELQAAIEA